MSDTYRSIADEVEAAVAAGSPDKCFETLKSVAGLLSASAGSLSEEQVALFGDVLDRLINTIELRSLAEIGARIALAELSKQLAPMGQAPTSVVRRLARNDDISVAEPVLIESARLSPEDLVRSPGTRANNIFWPYPAAGGSRKSSPMRFWPAVTGASAVV